MSFDTLQESRILRKILRIVGLWVDDGEHQHRVPSIVVGLLIHGPLTFSYTILMWIDVFVSSDLTQATDVLYIALTETALVVKIISILTHRKLARSIFDVWQTDDRFKLQSLEERLMWKESFATFTIVSIPYIACSLSVVGCTFAAALFTNVYRLPFSYWTPFDCHDPKYYWYAYFYGAIAMPLTCIANCTLDMWQCYMMQHLAVSFKLIATRLEKLGRSEHEPHSVVMRKLIRIIQLEQKVKRC